MYPLKAILVGCGEAAILDLHQELADQAVTIEAEFPDVKTVVGHLPLAQTDKRLFLVEVNTPDDLHRLERLNDTYVGRPLLALVGGGSRDPGLMLRAVRVGAAQVVALPLDRADFADALARIARQFGYAVSECKIIAVAGVTAGAGATTVAISLAAAIAARHHLSTVLTELGQQVGKLAVSLNLRPRFTTHDLLANPERLDINLVRESLAPVEDHFQVLAGAYQSINSVPPSLPQVLRLLEHVRQLANVIVVDMPYSYDELYFAVLSVADEVVLIAEQKVTSVHSLVVMRDALEQKAITARQFLVVNRYHPGLEDLDAAHLRELLQVKELETIRNDYESVCAATNNGRPLHQQAPHSAALADIERLADKLLGAADPRPNRTRLVDRFRHVWKEVWRR